MRHLYKTTRLSAALVAAALMLLGVVTRASADQPAIPAIVNGATVAGATGAVTPPSDPASGSTDPGTPSSDSVSGPAKSVTATDSVSGTVPIQTTAAAGAGSDGSGSGVTADSSSSTSTEGAGTSPSDSSGTSDNVTSVSTTDGEAGTGSSSTNSATSSTGTQDANSQSQPGGTSATPAGGTTASSSSTQVIWQVQASGCSAHCQGLSQSQVATQQNTTTQVASGAHPGAAATPQDEGQASSQGDATVTQIQIGCLQKCFGDTTTTAALTKSGQQAVSELLQALGVPRPAQTQTAATQENFVQQTIHQWQMGDGVAVVQTQGASQQNSTVQTIGLDSALTSELQAALGSSQPPTVVDNQSTQTIWQIQIGCLYFCVQTQQDQQAEQSNTTIEVILPTAGATAESTVQSAALAVDQASQLVWQVQIGCIFWCYDATQQQSASQQNTLVVVSVAAPSAAAPGDPGLSSGDSSPSTQVPSQPSSAVNPSIPTPTGISDIGSPTPSVSVPTATTSLSTGVAGGSSVTSTPSPAPLPSIGHSASPGRAFTVHHLGGMRKPISRRRACRTLKHGRKTARKHGRRMR